MTAAADGRGWGFQQSLALGLATVMAASGCTISSGPGDEAKLAGGTNRGAPSLSTPLRGPGTQPRVVPGLRVPRTLDLSHVQPAHFADALGRDSDRIFAYVRDNIAYEPYAGTLRGARGTLLAMAGNGLDRAILFASLLEGSGHTVRYVRGTLSPEAAAALVASVIPARVARPAPTSGGDTSPLDVLHSSIARDYEILRSRLAPVADSAVRGISRAEALVLEARAHFWVQIAQGGNWRDLDPSFADAIPGRAYAKAEQILERIPEELSHRITLRIRVEDQGESGTSIREVLTYSAPAPTLSGEHLMLVHLPEAWNGPDQTLSAQTLPAAGSSKIKPVLSVGQEIIQGQVFRQVPEPSVATTVSSLLGGSSVAKGATAEWLDIELISPDGKRQTITRGIFDLVGVAQRSQGPGAVSPVAFDPGKFVDLRGPIYDVFVTTGRIDTLHLPAAEEIQGVDVGPAEDVTRSLRALTVGAVAVADALTSGLRGKSGSFVFYPDSPRVHIVELAGEGKSILISLDLRRDTMRAVAKQSGTQDVFFANVFRGVVNGTLERLLGDQLLEGLGSGAVSHLNTSQLFDRAYAEQVPLLLLPQESDKLNALIPAEARARLEAEVQRGFLVVVPSRALTFHGAPRLAWWRMNPQTGEAVGVTDEGLHQGGAEKSGTEGASFHITRAASGGWWVHVVQGGFGYARPFTLAWGDTLGIRALAIMIWKCLKFGYRFRLGGPGPYTPI